MSHARFSPSSSSRWLYCTKSLTLPEKPDKGSPAAIRGTALHDLSDDLLNKRQPSLFYGEYAPTSEDILETVIPYVQYIENIDAEYKFFERKVFVNEYCYGTADCITFKEDCQTLEIVDLKCGRGFVSVNDNTQLKIYAIGAINYLRELGLEVKNIITTIFQPKSSGKTVKSATVEFEHLREFRGEVIKAVNDVLGGTTKYYPSSKTCFWCPHKQECPELRKDADIKAKEDFLNL